jgi:hypothetical protein
MEEDLDINNYNLDDILELFKLSIDFSYEDLKKVYKVVLKTHPDKSGLDKEYFIFYSKAFKELKSIYDYRIKYIEESKNNECVTRQIYNNKGYNKNDIPKDALDKVLKSENFNEWFNKTFEKVKLEDDEQDSGYGEWLKSEENINNISVTSKENLHNLINEAKNEIRNKALVNYKGIQDIYTSGVCQSSLTRDKLEEYSSGLFSKLQYEDLRKAHTETVVPVTEEDYNNREKYKNVHELENSRRNINILSKEESNRIMKEREAQENKESMYRSYKMYKQMESIKESNKKFYSSLRQLKG